MEAADPQACRNPSPYTASLYFGACIFEPVYWSQYIGAGILELVYWSRCFGACILKPVFCKPGYCNPLFRARNMYFEKHVKKTCIPRNVDRAKYTGRFYMFSETCHLHRRDRRTLGLKSSHPLPPECAAPTLPRNPFSTPNAVVVLQSPVSEFPFPQRLEERLFGVDIARMVKTRKYTHSTRIPQDE